MLFGNKNHSTEDKALSILQGEFAKLSRSTFSKYSFWKDRVEKQVRITCFLWD